MDTEVAAVSNFRRFWGFSVCLGLLAALLEWLRVDPTFGTSVSVWLFFPLLAVAWRGFWAGIITAVVASTLILLFGRALFLPFDAAVFIGTTAAVGWCCAKGQTSRVIDGVLLSWLIVVPATVLFHLALYRRDLNAGILITTTTLLSQLVPAMLVQWLAFSRRPMVAVEKLFGPRRASRPVHLLVIVRAVVIPMILLPLLVTQYFSITQWLLGQTVLEDRKATLYGELLVGALQGSLASLPFDDNDDNGENLPDRVKSILMDSRIESPAGAMAFEVEWVETATAGPTTAHFLQIDEAPARRSPIDWLMYRRMAFDVESFDTVRPGQKLRVTVPFFREAAEEEQFKIWGLLSALLFLILLEVMYRFAMVRLIDAFDRFGAQIAEWVPGQPLEVIGDTARGKILQVDQYADGVTQLVSDFNDNYRVLSEANAERRKLLARVSAILRSVTEPVIVTNAQLEPLPNFCNNLGRQWAEHLSGSLKATADRLVEPEVTPSQEDDPFVKMFVAAVRGDQSTLDQNLTLEDWEGQPHEFGLSFGLIGSQSGQHIYHHGTNAIDGFVILLTDISKLLIRQWAAGRRTRLESLETVASGVAHEINQPLNIIRVVSRNLLHKAETNALEPSVLQNKLERIDEQVGRVASLVRTMRAFSSSEIHDVAAIDPNGLIRNITTLMSGSLRSIHADMVVNVAKDAHTVLANTNSLGHVFAEITQNSLESLQLLPEGKPRRLSITTRVEGSGWLAVFEDSGGGIPPDVLDRIFEPFFTTKEQAVHTGSGLHEASRIIAGFGGTLVAENTAQGARFTVSLPIKERA